MKLYVFILLAFLLFSACTSEKKGSTTASSQSLGSLQALELRPLEATRETTFYINAKSLDLSKAKVQWFVNEKMVEEGASSQFKLSDIKKRDVIQAKVLIGDKQIVSNQIVVENISPTIANAKIIPSSPKANDILKADVVGSDRDGDSVTFIYEWSKNGEFAGSSETLEYSFKRGDKIFLKITPYDGDGYGQPMILTTNIYNSPPRPVTGSIEKFENYLYSYQVKATDPDGDALTYSLKSAPSGMTIDPSTGLIKWNVPPDLKGNTPITIAVTDGQGGEAAQNLTLDIRSEQR